MDIFNEEFYTEKKKATSIPIVNDEEIYLAEFFAESHDPTNYDVPESNPVKKGKLEIDPDPLWGF
jgi:hypothetical protein